MTEILFAFLIISLSACSILETTKPQKLVFVDSINKVAVPYGEGIGVVTEADIREYGYTPPDPRQKEYYERRLAKCFNQCTETRWTSGGQQYHQLNASCNEACMRADGWKLYNVPYSEDRPQQTPPPEETVKDDKVPKGIRPGYELPPRQRIEIPEMKP
jgi:hypothetical protein